MPAPEPDRPAGPLSPRWWVTSRDGNVVVAQWPNAALWVWLFTFVPRVTGVVGAESADLLAGVGRGALIVWGLDEVVRGASPVRRLLGAAVLVAQVVGLVIAE